MTHKKKITLRGIVETPPAVVDGHLEFPVRCGGDRYFIIRLDPAWQKQDIVFLDTDQAVAVSGIIAEDRPMTVLANKITIRSCPVSRLLHEKTEKEREINGNSGH